MIPDFGEYLECNVALRPPSLRRDSMDALSRMMPGRHYPTDVVAGAVIGILPAGHSLAVFG